MVDEWKQWGKSWWQAGIRSRGMVSGQVDGDDR